MEEFIGKKVKVEYVQEIGWKLPVSVTIDKKFYAVEKVLSRWEEHSFGKPWWRRKHQVWYLLELADGYQYHLYWDRGAKGTGQGWYLVKRIKE